MSEILLQSVVYVFNAEGKVMLGYKSPTSPFCAGKLTPPGGKFGPGESPKDSAERETLEETAVRPILKDFELGIVYIEHAHGPNIKLYVYRTTDFTGEPRSVEKLERVGWYDLNDDTISQAPEGDDVWLHFVRENKRFIAYVPLDQDGKVLRGQAEAQEVIV